MNDGDFMTDEKVNNSCAVALGNFDGLHIGHQKVLENTLALSKKHNLKSKVMLFDIHPKEFISGQKVPKLLSDEKSETVLKKMGFEICRINFSKIRNMTCKEFFSKIIIDELNAKAVCCGFNYSFGKSGLGDSNTIKELCAENDIKCQIAEPVKICDEFVSSTAIRNYILSGEPENAAKMLGRNFCISGEIIHGDKRGRTLGFPTANQKIDSSLVVPKFGVYQTVVNINGKLFNGVTNIGIRPTYLSECPLAETYIIDFDDSIYGSRIDVQLVKYMREEIKFDSAEQLKQQMIKDSAEVQKNVHKLG